MTENRQKKASDNKLQRDFVMLFDTKKAKLSVELILLIIIQWNELLWSRGTKDEKWMQHTRQMLPLCPVVLIYYRHT